MPCLRPGVASPSSAGRAHERLAEARAVFTELGALPLLAMAGGGAAETERPA